MPANIRQQALERAAALLEDLPLAEREAVVDLVLAAPPVTEQAVCELRALLPQPDVPATALTVAGMVAQGRVMTAFLSA